MNSWPLANHQEILICCVHKEGMVTLSSTVRADIDARGLGDDIYVQSSRSGGTAGPNSDIDIAIRVSPERFREIINDPALSRLSSPNPGSALDRTSTESLVEGRIQTGEARLGNLRDSLEHLDSITKCNVRGNSK